MSAPTTAKPSKSVGGVKLVKGALGAKKAGAMPENLNDSAPAGAKAIIGKKRKTAPSAPTTPPGNGRSLSSSSSSSATPEAKRVRAPKTVGTFVPKCPDDFKAAARMLGVNITVGEGAQLCVKKMTRQDGNSYDKWDQSDEVHYITYGDGKRQPVSVFFSGHPEVNGKLNENKMVVKPIISQADYDELTAWRMVWFKILWITGQKNTKTPMLVDAIWEKFISKTMTPKKWVRNVFAQFASWREDALESPGGAVSPEVFPTDFDEVVKMHSHPSMQGPKGNALWTERVKISGEKSGSQLYFVTEFNLDQGGDYPKPLHLPQVQKGGKAKNKPIRELHMMKKWEFGKIRTMQSMGLYEGGAVFNYKPIYERWGVPTIYLTPAKGTKKEAFADLSPDQKRRRKQVQNEESKKAIAAEFAATADAYDSDEDTGASSASSAYGTSYD